jgi:hypothetical protein
MSSDINAIRQRHLRPEQMEHRTFYEGHIAIDLANLCDEVEHLRGERAGMDEWLRTMIPNDKATAAERAAVVAWLRAQAYLTLYEATPSDVADAIERGEHRRGEGA